MTLWIMGGVIVLLSIVLLSIEWTGFKRFVKFVIPILLIGGVGYLVWKWDFLNQKLKPSLSTTSQGVQQSPIYELTWQLPRGVRVEGKNQNKANEKLAEVIFQSNGDMQINVPYEEYGRVNVTRFRLKKQGVKRWEGYWEQDDPADNGFITSFEEVTPGVWTGLMTVKDKLAKLTLVRIK